jgi:hypothetical protein
MRDSRRKTTCRHLRQRAVLRVNRRHCGRTLHLFADDAGSRIQPDALRSVELLWQLANDRGRLVRCTVAEHPNVPVETLMQLAKDQDLDVRRAVAAHPDTPIDALRQPAAPATSPPRQSTDTVLRARSQTSPPKKDFINLPPELQKYTVMTPGNVKTVLSLKEVSRAYRARFAELGAYDLMGLGLPHDFPSQITRLNDEDKSFMHSYAEVTQHFYNSETNTWTVEASQALAGSPYLLPSLKARIVRPLMRDEYVVCEDIADHPRTPMEVLCVLARGWVNLRKLVASHPNASDDMLRDFEYDYVVNVRCAVAQNPAAPEDLRLKLESDPVDAVRHSLAANSSQRVETLRRFAAQEHAAVDISLATNPTTPVDILERLAIHDLASVRKGVAKNRSATGDMLATLATDDDVEVLAAVAENPNLSPERLAELASHTDVGVVRAVADNPRAPVATLADLADHADVDMVSLVAQNPSTPKDAIVKLAKDGESTKDYLAFNPGVQKALSFLMIHRLAHEQVDINSMIFECARV